MTFFFIDTIVGFASSVAGGSGKADFNNPNFPFKVPRTANSLNDTSDQNTDADTMKTPTRRKSKPFPPTKRSSACKKRKQQF